MNFSMTAQVPSPDNGIVGHVAGYTKWVTYLDSNGKPAGKTKLVKLYNGRGSACLQGGVYRVVHKTDTAAPLQVATCAAQTVDQMYVVAMNATADATWDWFAIEGEVNALVDGDTTDVAVGDSLKITAGTNADAFVQDQAVSSSTMVPSADTLAVALEANTGAEALKKVRLLGQRADID